MIEENTNVVEYEYYSDPLDTFFDSFETNPELAKLDEVTYQERAEKAVLQIEVLDVDRYIKVNELEDELRRFSKLSFNPLGTANMLKENYNLNNEQYSQDDLNLINAMINR